VVVLRNKNDGGTLSLSIDVRDAHVLVDIGLSAVRGLYGDGFTALVVRHESQFIMNR
jgi:hypothetical protein